jgi:hypothetical protein
MFSSRWVEGTAGTEHEEPGMTGSTVPDKQDREKGPGTRGEAPSPYTQTPQQCLRLIHARDVTAFSRVTGPDHKRSAVRTSITT